MHDKILVMDNAAIHTGAEAEIVEDLLWYMVVDGRPLNVLVVYLPARAPELNPIELIFLHSSSSNPLILVPDGRSMRCCCRSSNGKGSERRNPRDDCQM
jgi:hypothetical protein